MFSDRSLGGYVGARFLRGLRCHTLGACSKPAKTTKYFRYSSGSLYLNEHNIPRSDGIPGFDNLHAFFFPVQQVCDSLDLALGDRSGQVRDDCQHTSPRDFATGCQINGRQVFARLDARSKAPASRGIKTISLQIHVNFRSEPVNYRQKAPLEKIEGSPLQLLLPP